MKFTLYPPQAIHELGQRDNQEDAIYPQMGEATVRDRLFILCDGMGGHEKGEVASNTISQALATYLDHHASADAIVGDDTLLDALAYAYRQLDAKDDGAARKMGTTLCLLLFHRGGATAMHIGDSRIYHIRPADHRMVYQSKDHSLVYDLYQAGEITYDEMRTSPQKNIITRAIQPGEDNRVRPAIVHITDIRPGDYFYICSDGMLEQMENEELCGLLSAPSSDEKKRRQLITATADNKDNHSAYLIHLNQVEHEGDDNHLPDDEQTSPDNALNITPQSTEVEDDVNIVAPASDVVARETPVPPKPKPDRHRNALYAIIGILAAVIVVLAVFIVKPKGLGKKDYKNELVDKTNKSARRIETIKKPDARPQVKVKKKTVVTKENGRRDTATQPTPLPEKPQTAAASTPETGKTGKDEEHKAAEADKNEKLKRLISGKKGKDKEQDEKTNN